MRHWWVVFRHLGEAGRSHRWISSSSKPVSQCLVAHYVIYLILRCMDGCCILCVSYVFVMSSESGHDKFLLSSTPWQTYVAVFLRSPRTSTFDFRFDSSYTAWRNCKCIIHVNVWVVVFSQHWKMRAEFKWHHEVLEAVKMSFGCNFPASTQGEPERNRGTRWYQMWHRSLLWT